MREAMFVQNEKWDARFVAMLIGGLATFLVTAFAFPLVVFWFHVLAALWGTGTGLTIQVAREHYRRVIQNANN